jgi:ribose transport system substrate-binding protein
MAAAAPAAGPKVGVLLKGQSDFWSAVAQGAASAGAAAGAEVVVKSPLDETDVAVQIRLLSALAAQGVQAVVIAPDNPETLAAPIAALAGRGIKVVVIDSPISGGGIFVGTDQRAAGRAAGALLASLTGPGDEISILKHSQTSVAATEREEGAVAALRGARADATIHADIYASSEPGVEEERARMLLERYPATRAILASGTPGTMAMLKVLEDRKDGAPVHFVGFGFNLNPAVADALRKGAMDGWVAQLPREVGAKGVQAALDLIAGKPVAPVIPTDFIVVTKANLGEPGVQALLAGG